MVGIVWYTYSIHPHTMYMYTVSHNTQAVSLLLYQDYMLYTHYYYHYYTIIIIINCPICIGVHVLFLFYYYDKGETQDIDYVYMLWLLLHCAYLAWGSENDKQNIHILLASDGKQGMHFSSVCINFPSVYVGQKLYKGSTNTRMQKYTESTLHILVLQNTPAGLVYVLLHCLL